MDLSRFGTSTETEGENPHIIVIHKMSYSRKPLLIKAADQQPPADLNMALSVCFESDKTVGKSGTNRTVNGDIAVVIFKIDTAPDHSVEAKDILIIPYSKADWCKGSCRPEAEWSPYQNRQAP